MIQGRGPGGSIQCLKFDSLCQDRVYTASIDGTVMRHDFSGADNKIYLGELQHGYRKGSWFVLTTHNPFSRKH